MKTYGSNEKGIVLISVYLVTGVLFVMGGVFLTKTIHEAKLSERERHAVEALYLAEGALHQILYDLRQDMLSSGSWSDGVISGVSFILSPSWQTFGTYVAAPMGDGTFTVELQEVTGNPRAVRIRANGTSANITRRLLENAEIVDVNPWNNVIFGGIGQAGNLINGNVDIRGSVHVLGESLDPEDLAMDLGGSGNIGNNYEGMPDDLRDKLPPPPQVVFNGEMVESLGAKVRIKNGKLGLSGTALAGEPDQPGGSPAVKETLRGTYITHGYGGNQGAVNVHSDNGTYSSYDLGNVVSFSTFSDPYKEGGVTYGSYSDFVQTRGLNLSVYGIDTIDTNTSDFGPFSDGNGNFIQWRRAPGPNPDEGTLTVTGVIYTTSSVEIGKKNKTVKYDGVGTLVALGNSSDIEIHGDLLSKERFVTDDTLAFIAQRNVEIATGPGESGLRVAGVFYGGTQVRSAKQTHLAGTFVSNYFDMGGQVPSIYQVPSFDPENHPGLIGRNPIYVMQVSSWQEVQ